MQNNWEHKKININSLFKSYDDKYGTSGSYADSQSLFFNNAEVKSCLEKSFSYIGDSSKTVLSIGINNGREIVELQKAGYLRGHMNPLIVGFDISKSALLSAKSHLRKIQHKLILGDIVAGVGNDISSKKSYILPERSFDLCLAFTSLSSSNVYAHSNYSTVLKRIISSMQDESSFLIIAPNCTIVNNTYKSGGTFLANTHMQDPDYAKNFINDTKKILKEHGYLTKTFGDKFLFLVAKRMAKH